MNLVKFGSHTRDNTQDAKMSLFLVVSRYPLVDRSKSEVHFADTSTP